MTAPDVAIPAESAADAMDPRLRSLPDLSAPIVSIASKVVRDYVRALLVEPAIKRQFGIGMGIIKFQTPVVVKDSVVMTEIEAPAAVQVKALHDLISIGVPPRTVGDDGPRKVMGVLVLGEIGMQVARDRAAQDRINDSGPPQLNGGEYVPPPGYEVVIVEDDLTGTVPPASPDDPPPQPPQTMTKAQRLAANRRAKVR